jgi:DegV family protein with EDD domain
MVIVYHGLNFISEIIMSKVAILTDTISCLPDELVKQYGIEIIPVYLVINRKNYKDTEISNEEFWRLFNNTREAITTNAANPADFEAIFQKLAQTNNTDSICCILVSKQLSATNKAAYMAKETLKQKIPSLKIEIIDSASATGAQGYIVLEAAKAAQAGKDLNEVVKAAQEMLPRVKFVTVMNTLKYLIRSGRAPKAAVIGNLLNVKPLIGMTNGSGLVENLGHERGLDKAIGKIIDMIKDLTDTSKPLHVMVHYTDDKAMGEKIKQMVTARYNCVEVYLTPYTPVMASQTGPVLAIAFYS